MFVIYFNFQDLLLILVIKLEKQEEMPDPFSPKRNSKNPTIELKINKD